MPDKDEKKNRRFEIAVQTRNLEIDLFWRRSLFFWGFIASAFIAYANLQSKEPKELALLVACFGFVCSVAWTLVNRGSKYWQEAWEQKVEREESDVLGKIFFTKWEPIQREKGWWLRARKFSVSKLAIALSDFTALVWLLILIATLLPIELIESRYVDYHDVIKLVLVACTIIYAALLISCGRTTHNSSGECTKPSRKNSDDSCNSPKSTTTDDA